MSRDARDVLDIAKILLRRGLRVTVSGAIIAAQRLLEVQLDGDDRLDVVRHLDSMQRSL